MAAIEAARIFICYRREDDTYSAGLLFDRLAERFGTGAVFNEVDSIRLDDDLAEQISLSMRAYTVLLVVIGQRWLATEGPTGRRLDDPTDLVRLEIEAALTHGIRVIPVLVDGAQMPAAQDLPSSIMTLADRQPARLASTSIDRDLDQLMSSVQVSPASFPSPDRRPDQPASPVTAERGRAAGYAFISYVREDTADVDRLEQVLEAAGIRVWRDTTRLWPGQDWRQAIRRAITDSALVFIACFSTRSLARTRSYQNEELSLAIEQLRIRTPDEPWLIPVRFDDCSVPDFDLGGGRTLNSIQRSDLFGNNFDIEAGRLSAAVLRILGQQTKFPPPAKESEPVPAQPARRLCVALDIKNYSSLTDRQQDTSQNILKSMIIQASRSTEGDDVEWGYQGTDTGLLAVAPYGTREEVLPSFIMGLHNQIRLTNHGVSPENHTRVLTAMASGEIKSTSIGYIGQAVEEAANLLDSTELRQALPDDLTKDLAIAVTHSLHQTTFVQAREAFPLLEFTRINVALADFHADAWICVPEIGADDDTTHLFFLSYGRSVEEWDAKNPIKGPSPQVKRFFDDLSRHVGQLIALESGVSPGFMDTSIEPGSHWNDDLLNSLGTCRVFIVLLSGSYVKSEWCGMEWDAFSRRPIIRYSVSAKYQDCMIPVFWSPFDETTIPGCVQEKEWFTFEDLRDADDSRQYRSEGVYGLLASAQDIAYQRVVWNLAKLIRTIHESCRVKPLKFRQEELRNAFLSGDQHRQM